MILRPDEDGDLVDRKDWKICFILRQPSMVTDKCKVGVDFSWGGGKIVRREES